MGIFYETKREGKTETSRRIFTIGSFPSHQQMQNNPIRGNRLSNSSFPQWILFRDTQIVLINNNCFYGVWDSSDQKFKSCQIFCVLKLIVEMMNKKDSFVCFNFNFLLNILKMKWNPGKISGKNIIT